MFLLTTQKLSPPAPPSCFLTSLVSPPSPQPLYVSNLARKETHCCSAGDAETGTRRSYKLKSVKAAAVWEWQRRKYCDLLQVLLLWRRYETTICVCFLFGLIWFHQHPFLHFRLVTDSRCVGFRELQRWQGGGRKNIHIKVMSTGNCNDDPMNICFWGRSVSWVSQLCQKICEKNHLNVTRWKKQCSSKESWKKCAYSSVYSVRHPYTIQRIWKYFDA